jgi:hypothetical protein
MNSLLKLWLDRIDFDIITILMCGFWFVLGVLAGMIVWNIAYVINV